MKELVWECQEFVMVIETSNRNPVRESVVSHRGRFQSVRGRKGINFKLGIKTAVVYLT